MIEIKREEAIALHIAGDVTIEDWEGCKTRGKDHVVLLHNKTLLFKDNMPIPQEIQEQLINEKAAYKK